MAIVFKCTYERPNSYTKLGLHLLVMINNHVKYWEAGMHHFQVMSRTKLAALLSRLHRSHRIIVPSYSSFSMFVDIHKWEWGVALSKKNVYVSSVYVSSGSIPNPLSLMRTIIPKKHTLIVDKIVKSHTLNG